MMTRTHSNPASRAASLFSCDHEPEEEPSGIYAMTFRLPSHMAATIAVMADHADQSRNEMAQLIISAGIQAIFQETPLPIRAEIEQSIADTFENFI
jgi:hypothetical protein